MKNLSRIIRSPNWNFLSTKKEGYSVGEESQLCLYYFILATCFGVFGEPLSGN